MRKSVIGYSFIAVGLLMAIYFFNYTGPGFPDPTFLWMLGVIIMVAGIVLLSYSPKTISLLLQKGVDERITQLKENGERIRVDLSQCTLKEHSYTEEKERYDGNGLLTSGFERQVQAWNALGDSTRNIKQVPVVQSVIIFSREHPVTGKEERFVSPVIPKDRITLAFYLEEQGATNLYVDKTDRENYYFDLDFLHKFTS